MKEETRHLLILVVATAVLWNSLQGLFFITFERQPIYIQYLIFGSLCAISIGVLLKYHELDKLV